MYSQLFLITFAILPCVFGHNLNWYTPFNTSLSRLNMEGHNALKILIDKNKIQVGRNFSVWEVSTEAAWTSCTLDSNATFVGNATSSATENTTLAATRTTGRTYYFIDVIPANCLNGTKVIVDFPTESSANSNTTNSSNSTSSATTMTSNVLLSLCLMAIASLIQY